MFFRVKFSASLLALVIASVSFGGAQAQSISQALTAAYKYAPDLQSALLAAKASAENIALAKSAKLPTIGGSLSATDSWSVAGGSFADQRSFNAGVAYNQTLFDNYKTEASIEQARAGAEAAEYQIQNTEQNVLLNVVQAYMTVLNDRELVDLRQENVNFFQAQLKSAQDRLNVGEGTKIDVAQAQARQAQGVSAYRAALASLEISKATFQRYVGAAPQNLSASHNFGRLVPSTLAKAIASAEANHPALRMAKAAIRAAQAGSDEAGAAFGPSVTFSSSVGTGISDPGGSQAISGQFKLGVSVPIYAGGALGASVRKANLNQIKSEVDAMSTYDQVRQSVISAWSGIQSADAQIEAANAAVSAGRDVVEGIVQERDLGTKTTLDVLNSQADLTTAREGLINASTQKVIATFSLLAATGQLTAQSLGLAVEVKSAANYTATVEDVWQELRSVDDK